MRTKAFFKRHVRVNLFLNSFVPWVKEGPLSVPSLYRYFEYNIWQDAGFEPELLRL